MIKCEICGKFFHIDEIEKCPECDIELCPSCYEDHINKCLNPYEESILDDNDLVTICPECGSNLELDTNYGTTNEDAYTTELICSNPNCSFKKSVKFQE